MTTVDLPALHGTDPLGFLAALGLLQVLTRHHSPQVALSFCDATGRARLHSDLASTDHIAAALTATVAQAGPHTAIVGVDDRFPLDNTAARALGLPTSAKDPMRVPHDRYQTLAAKVAELGAPASGWLPHLVTDLAVDRGGRAALTPFCAPAGRQTLRQFFATPLQAVRDQPAHLHQALVAWRRVDGFTGEYLDHRVMRDAADRPEGVSAPAGVPGATWLATQALRLLRLSGDGRHPTATLWHRHHVRSVMLWPLWSRPLTTTAVSTLLEHPALAPTNTTPSSTTPLTVAPEPLHHLGAFTIAAAERRPLRDTNSAGVLLPLPVTWHRPPAPHRPTTGP